MDRFEPLLLNLHRFDVLLGHVDVDLGALLHLLLLQLVLIDDDLERGYSGRL